MREDISRFGDSESLMRHGVKDEPWEIEEKGFAPTNHSQSCKV
jgi:hypothetical protein